MEKNALAVSAEGGNSGYVGIGVEQLDEKHGDSKEAFDAILAFPAVGSKELATRDALWPGWSDALYTYFDAAK